MSTKTATKKMVADTKPKAKAEKVEKVEKVAKVEKAEVEGDIKKKNRSFKVKLSEDSELYGRYNGDSPYQAANKALSEIIRNKVKANDKVDADISFFLVESTKGSAKKMHQYVGKRVQLDNPVKYKVGNQEIIKNFKNILKKVKRAEGEKPAAPKKAVAGGQGKKVAVQGKKVAVAGKKAATKKVAAVAKKVAAPVKKVKATA